MSKHHASAHARSSRSRGPSPRHRASRRTSRALAFPVMLILVAIAGLGVAGAATLAASPWSDDVSVTTKEADAAPAQTSDRKDDRKRTQQLPAPAEVGGEALSPDKIRLTWDSVEGADGYQIERDGEVVAGEVRAAEYVDTGLEAGTTYDYRIRAYARDSGAGTWSHPHKVNGDKGADEKEQEDEAETDEPSADEADSEPGTDEQDDVDEEAAPLDADEGQDSEPEPVACDYFGAPSPTGAEDGSSEGDAFRIEDFWEVAQPGTTLCLTDGTYTGGASMIQPPEGLSGTESDRITVRALNDGEVLIDGEGDNGPIRLAGSSWFVIEGVNAANSSSDVVHLSTDADHNVLRRIVAWDAEPTGNSMVYRLNGNTGNLLEDTAGFGWARKTYQASQRADDTTFRRTWGMWNGSETDSVKQTYSVAYESLDNTCENCIGTFDADERAYPENRRGIFSNNSMTRSGLTDGIASNSGYWGSIAYTLADQETSELRGLLESFRVHDGFTFENTVAYTEQSDVRTTRLRGDSGQSDKSYRHGTEIGPGGSSIDDSWDVSDRVTADAVEDAPSIWSGSGSEGAHLCHRYVDRELTDEPLWPWPMDERISEALELAGREPVDVTATMEDLFGAIPEECRNS